MRHDPGTPSNPAEAASSATPRLHGRRYLRRPLRRLVIGAVAVMGVMGVASMSASAAGSTVDALATATFGTVLTDAQGFALYTLPTDQNGMSSCTGACVAVWPALTVTSGTTPTAGPGVGGTVSSVLQSNGTYQVTFNGSPLYTFAGDTTPGEVTGNNVGGFKVAQVTAAPSTTTTPPTTAPSTAASTPASSPSTSVAGASSPSTTPAPASASPGASGQPATAATAVSSAPTTLAVTGPGPALLWMVIVGAGLLVVSVLLLMVVGDAERWGRRALIRTLRAGEWMLGRENPGPR